MENNKIICGDALNVLPTFPSNSIDLIITSPPYFMQREYTNNDIREIGMEKTTGIYLQILIGVFNECVRVIKPTGNIIWNMGDIYKDKCLQLIPYRFAINVIDHYKDIKLINEITWVKTNPTPRQYNKRLISSTEPFFHFVKSEKYYYNRDAFLDYSTPSVKKISKRKGENYRKSIIKSDLTLKEKFEAIKALNKTLEELQEGAITDFRMKVRGVHKKAFGGQSGGRNNQMDNSGYTIIKMYGKKLKRDVIESAVANTKNIDHPAVFPINIIKELILLLSKEEDVVLDPFCGSGQVLIASDLLKRRYLGIDLSEKYCDISKHRLSEGKCHEKK